MSTKATAVMPTKYLAYAQEAMIGVNDLIAQGIVEYDRTTLVGQEGLFYTNPYQQSLDNVGAVTQIVANTTEVTPDAPSDYSIIVPKVMYSKGLTQSNFDSLFRGASSIQQVGGQIATYWSEQIQNKIVANWSSMFATGGALVDTTHVFSPGVTLSASVITKATALHGEKMGRFDKMIMNSSVVAALADTGVIVPIPTTQIGNEVLNTGSLMSFLGKRIIINDTLCAEKEDGTYPTYLVAGSPYYVGLVESLRVEPYRRPNIGGGTDEYYYTMAFAMGMKGVSYKAGTYPATDALLATAGSFERKWALKNIPIVEINCPLAV